MRDGVHARGFRDPIETYPHQYRRSPRAIVSHFTSPQHESLRQKPSVQAQKLSQMQSMHSEEKGMSESTENNGDKRLTILSKIVVYLKEYPFLLVSIAGLIILTLVFSFETEKLKEFKWLLYAIVLVPLVMQFYFEAKKHRREDRRLEQEAHAAQQALNSANGIPAQQKRFNVKAIVSMAFILLAFAGYGDLGEDEFANLDIHYGVFGISLFSLVLGVMAWGDIRKNRSKGAVLAGLDIGFSLLLILASIGDITTQEAAIAPYPATQPLSQPAPSPYAHSFNGIYYGTMHDDFQSYDIELQLNRTGDLVTGTYTDGLSIGVIQQGVVNQGRLDYVWQLGTFYGRGVLIEQGGQLSGSWGYEESVNNGGGILIYPAN